MYGVPVFRIHAVNISVIQNLRIAPQNQCEYIVSVFFGNQVQFFQLALMKIRFKNKVGVGWRKPGNALSVS